MTVANNRARNIQIACIVGNGFDLKAGLDTSTKSFARYYSERYQDDESSAIRVLAQCIKEDGEELWSNFEYKLGQYTSHIQDIESSFEMKTSIDVALRDFIAAQNNRLSDTYIESTCQQFFNSIHSWYESLSPQEKTEIFPSDTWRTFLHYDFISFNYTLTLDKLLIASADKNPFIEPISDEIYHYFHGEVLHPHGILEEGQALITGVDSASQINNPLLAESSDFVQVFVKREQLKLIQNDVYLTCEEKIAEADILLLFGVSLGETDGSWWRNILDGVTNNKAKRVIFFQHKLEKRNRNLITKSFEYFKNVEAYREELLSKLAEITGFDIDIHEIENQFIILPSDCIFNLRDINMFDKR